MIRIECPGCGGVTELERIARKADEFCGGCDYPLFWAVPVDEDLDDDLYTGSGVIDPSLRRRPGTSGRKALVGEPCPNPSCKELNPVTAVFCLRCGVELHPAPAPEPEPEPEPAPPEPEPVIVERVPIGALVAAAAALVGIVALAIVLGVWSQVVAVLLLAGAAGALGFIWWQRVRDDDGWGQVDAT